MPGYSKRQTANSKGADRELMFAVGCLLFPAFANRTPGR
jgi:hypothetical protein